MADRPGLRSPVKDEPPPTGRQGRSRRPKVTSPVPARGELLTTAGGGAPESPERRTVCLGVAAAIGAAITAALALPMTGMLLSPVLRRPRRIQVPLAPAGRFRGRDPIPVVFRFRQRQGWREREVTRTVFVLPSAGGEPAVLSSRCPHLGCQVRWDSGSGEFLCPCHGGRFDREGLRVAGPPPGPLARLQTTVRDGILYVDEATEV